MHRLKRTIDAQRLARNCTELHFGFIFLKLTDADARRRVEVGKREVGGVWYTGQVRWMKDLIEEKEWVSSTIEYGVHKGNGRYEVLSREACEKITGPEAMRREDGSEESWEYWGS